MAPVDPFTMYICVVAVVIIALVLISMFLKSKKKGNESVNVDNNLSNASPVSTDKNFIIHVKVKMILYLNTYILAVYLILKHFTLDTKD